MEEAVILQKIRDLYRRCKQVEGIGIFFRTLVSGLIISAVFLFFVKITGLFLNKSDYYIFPIFFSFVLGLVFAFSQKKTLKEIALESDEKLQLKERLSTALEWIEDNKVRSPMFRALLRQTAEVAKAIDEKQVFPFFWKKPARRFSLALVALVIVFYLPSFSLFVPRIQPGDVKLIKKEARKIKNVSKKIENKKTKNIENRELQKNTIKELNTLSRELNKPGTTKKAAITRISKSRDKINEMLEPRKNMAEKARLLKDITRSSDDKSKSEPADTFDKLSKTFKKMASDLNNKNMSEQEKSQMAQELEKISQKMNKAGMDSQKLKQALDNIKSGNQMQASEQLEQLAQQFENRQADLEDLEQLEGALAQLESSKNAMSGQGGQMAKLPEAKMVKTGEKFPGDFGDKTANQEEKSTGETNNKYSNRFNEDEAARKEMYEKLYDPRRDESETYISSVKGKFNQGKILNSYQSSERTAPGEGGSSRADPADVYLKHKVVGEDAVNRGNYPARYKNLVKEYYEQINPQR
ncbi:MAG: hypothetical protein ACLFQV_07490 [Vulcanimicrobiota bacterium]